MDAFELSEINFGLVQESRVSAKSYSPEDFLPPYDEFIRILQQEGASKEDLAKCKSASAVILQKAHDAVKRLNGLGEFENFDWRTALIEATRKYNFSRKHKRDLEKLERNEEVDLMPFYGDMGAMVAGESTGLVLASEVDYKTYKPFMKCGYAPLDNVLGGIPTDGPIIIYGLTGAGKSFFAANMAECLLRSHPEFTGAIYTLEMAVEHYLYRTTNMYPTFTDIMSRLHVSGAVRKMEDLVAEISTKRINFVIMDDMDNMVKSKDAAEYERNYQMVKDVCRFEKIPFFVLGQPNRLAKLKKEFLGPYDVAWSGAAENSAALQIALQKANSLDMDDTTFATFDEDKWYLILWKSRDGWNDREGGQEGPGAIILDKSNRMWRGKPVNGKYTLFRVGSGARIGKKKIRKEDDDL